MTWSESEVETSLEQKDSVLSGGISNSWKFRQIYQLRQIRGFAHQNGLPTNFSPVESPEKLLPTFSQILGFTRSMPPGINVDAYRCLEASLPGSIDACEAHSTLNINIININPQLTRNLCARQHRDKESNHPGNISSISRHRQQLRQHTASCDFWDDLRLRVCPSS